MLSRISVTNLQRDVQTLVGFGTRHSLSSQNDPVRGVGAAESWLLAQLQTAAVASNGAMTVQAQTFVQAVSSNVPVPTPMTNIVATLQGTDPTAASRVYVVSAHYDDRVTDVFDFTDDAPGADEDASGVAALLELARVMAAHPAKATIEFALFDGEEQGLYGSSFFASQSKAELVAGGAGARARGTGGRAGAPPQRPFEYRPPELEREPGLRRGRVRGGVARFDRRKLDSRHPGGRRDRVHHDEPEQGRHAVRVRAVNSAGDQSPVAFPTFTS